MMHRPLGPRHMQPVKGSATPTPTASTGTLTSASATFRYTQYFDRVFFNATISITTNGTGGTDLRLTMPVTAAETTAIAGTENSNAFSLAGFVSGTTLAIKKYDGSYPGADGWVLHASGNFRV